jgi:hypothetical protein
MRGGRAFVPSGTLAHVAPNHPRQIRKQLLGATVGAGRSYLAPKDEGAPLIHMFEGLGYEDVWRKNLEQLLVKWWKTIA